MLHTLFWPLLVFLSVAMGIQKLRIRFPSSLVNAGAWLTRAAMWVMMAALLISAVYYVFIPGYFDHIEENIAAAGAFWRHGYPLYHSMDSADRYTLLYGPLPFVLNGWFQSLPIDIFVASKLPGVLCLVAGFILFASLVIRRKEWSWNKKILLLALYSGIMVYNEDMSYWDRPDSFLIFFAIAALVVVETISSTWKVALLTGILAGLSSAGKIHGAGTLIPLLVYFLEMQKPKNFLGPVLGFGAAYLLATGFWFLLPGIDLTNYVSTLREASGHGLKLDLFLSNVTSLLPLFAFLVLTRFYRFLPWTFSALSLMFLLTAIIASKAGAGPYHLLPYVPVFLYFCGLAETHVESSSREFAHLFAICYFLGISTQVPKQQKAMIRFWLQQPAILQNVEDLRNLEQSHPGPKAMAPSDDESYGLMQLTPELVSRGGRLFLDGPSVMDFVLGGGHLPEATYQAIAGCEIPEFILPSKGEPWSMTDWYSRQPLYPERLRTVFNAAYEKVDTIGAFSLYRCKQTMQN